MSVAKRQVAQSPADRFPARVIGLPLQGKPEGNAVDNPYHAFPFYKLEAVVPDGSVPVGFWRSVGHSHTAFFDESFVDELASALKGSVRVPPRASGRQAAPSEGAGDGGEGGGLKQPLPAGSGGIALRASFGSIVAQVAEVVVADGNTLQVKRVTCAIDCGPVVNPAIVRAQMESGIIYGLSAALYGEIRWPTAPSSSRTSRLRRRAPGRCAGDDGASGRHRFVFRRRRWRAGTPPIAPAVANAVFAATGKRLRSLPLRLG